jgi:hypothetical protein
VLTLTLSLYDNRLESLPLMSFVTTPPHAASQPLLPAQITYRVASPRFGNQPQTTPNANISTTPATRPVKSRFAIPPSVRFGLGFILEDIVPPLLGFAFLAGPMGFLLTIASAPISFLSGKLGRRLIRGVNDENSSARLKKVHAFRDFLKNPGEDKEQFVSKWNKGIGDLLNIRESRFSGPLRFMANRLKVSQGGQNFISRIVNNPNFLKARIYHDISQSNSIGGAVKSGAKGGLMFCLYHKVLPKIGRMLEGIAAVLPGPLKWACNAIGKLLKDFGWAVMFKDMLWPPKKPAAV